MVIEYSSNSPFHRYDFVLIKKRNFDVTNKWVQSQTQFQLVAITQAGTLVQYGHQIKNKRDVGELLPT